MCSEQFDYTGTEASNCLIYRQTFNFLIIQPLFLFWAGYLYHLLSTLQVGCLLLNCMLTLS